MQVEIRPAESADIPVLVALLGLLLAEEQDFTPDPARQHTALEMMLKDPKATLLVADHVGEVAGFCGVQLLISTASGGFAAQIEDIVIDPLWRGRGLGTRLLDAAAVWAKERGAVRLQLYCDDQNCNARSFYEARGWHRVHLIPYFKQQL